MTDDVSSLGRFLSNVDAKLARQTKDAPNGAETVLTKIKILFPDTYRQMEKEGVLQLLENPEGLRTYLHEFFKKHREANLPEHVEPRASEASPGEVAKRVETYETATREADRALHSREGRIRELRAAYVKRVAQNFIDQTRAYYEREAKEVSQSVTAQIERAQRDAADIPDRIEARQIETYIRQVEENLPQFPEKPAVRMRAQEQAKDLNVQYAEATRQHEAAKEAVVEAKKRFFASDNPTTRPDVLLTRAVELSATTPYGATDVARVAELQARAVEFQALDASAVALGGHGFFQTIADPANPGELKRASAADRLFDSLRPEQKMVVVRDIIDRSLARFEGPVAKATEAVGEKVAASQITANAIRQAIQTGDTVRGASTAGSVGAVAEGLFRSFGGIPPQTLQLVGQSKTLEWLNTQSFYAFLMVEKLKTSLGGAGKFVIKEGAEAVAKKVGGKSIGGAIGAWLGTALPLPPGISNAIGYVVGDVILDKIIEWGGAALSAVGYVFSGGVLTSILQGKPASLTDTLFLFPLLIIVLIPLLFIFPWVLNIPQFSDDVRRTALLESMGGGENTPIVDCRATQTNPTCNADVPPVGIDCNATQTNPQCKVEACIPKKAGDCMWPTTGYITQGPQSHCGTIKLSHASMNAIDIGASYNTPVIAVKGGQITAWEPGCADQPLGPSKTWGCNGGWGNYIDITGGGYTLRYAHLAFQSMGLTHHGMQVSQGQVIGKVDNNGNSSGNHLHFGVQSGGSILSILPVSPQQAQQIQGCVNLGGCPNACPAIPVSTH